MIEKRIKEIREEQGLKQYEVADKMGLERPNYTRLENRGNKMTIEQLQQIASALGVTLKEILFEEKGSDLEVELYKKDLELSFAQKEIALLKEIIKDKERIINLKNELQ